MANQDLISKVGGAYSSGDGFAAGAGALGAGIVSAATSIAKGLKARKKNKETKEEKGEENTGSTLTYEADGINIADPVTPSGEEFEGAKEISLDNSMSAFGKRSPMKYNAALVNAVGKAYGGGNLMSPGDIDKLTKPIFNTLNQLGKNSRRFAKKAVALRKSKNESFEGKNPEIISRVVELQNKADEVLKKGGGFFRSARLKTESLQEIANIESAIKRLKNVDSHVKQIEAHALQNLDNIGGVVNVENQVMWNTIASGNIWKILEDDGRGGFTMPNPMGEGRIDVLTLDLMPTKDLDYEDNELKARKSVTKLFKNKDISKDNAMREISVITKKLNKTNPDSKYDDPDFMEFAKEHIYSNRSIDQRMFDNNISEYMEVNTMFEEEADKLNYDSQTGEVIEDEAFENHKQNKLDLYINTMKPMDIEKEWVEFKTKKLEQVYTDLEEKKRQDNINAKNLQEDQDAKNIQEKGLSWQLEKESKQKDLQSALTRLKTSTTTVKLAPNIFAHPQGDGKYYLGTSVIDNYDAGEESMKLKDWDQVVNTLTDPYNPNN